MPNSTDELARMTGTETATMTTASPSRNASEAPPAGRAAAARSQHRRAQPRRQLMVRFLNSLIAHCNHQVLLRAARSDVQAIHWQMPQVR